MAKSVITNSEWDKEGLPYVELPDRPMVFVACDMQPDLLPENKGRMQTFREQSIPTKDIILNKDGEEVEIGFIVTRKFDEKSKSMVPVYGDISLERGYLIVDPKKEAAKFRFLMRSNRNKSNPRAIQRYPFIFSLLEPDKKKEEQFLKITDEIEAVIIIYKETDMNKIKAFARAIGVDIEQMSTSIRHDVIIRVQKDPQLIKLFDTVETKIKAMVYTAIDHGIISINKEPYSVGWLDENTYLTICPVPAGKNKVDYFVNFLQTEPSGVIDALKGRLQLEVDREFKK